MALKYLLWFVLKIKAKNIFSTVLKIKRNHFSLLFHFVCWVINKKKLAALGGISFYVAFKLTVMIMFSDLKNMCFQAEQRTFCFSICCRPFKNSFILYFLRWKCRVCWICCTGTQFLLSIGIAVYQIRTPLLSYKE